MLNFTKKKQTKLEKEISLVLDKLKKEDVGTEEYQNILDHLSKLYEMKQKDKSSISPDTVAVVVGNLLGIILILKHEELNVITSKALGFVIRGRA